MIALAAAASSSIETYGGQGGSIAHQTQASALPFSGLDAAVLIGVGLVLFIAGLVLARLATN